jgi:hypothetical protein
VAMSSDHMAEEAAPEPLVSSNKEDRLYRFWLAALTVLVMFCALAIAAVAFNHGFHHGVMATIFILLLLGVIGFASLE